MPRKLELPWVKDIFGGWMTDEDFLLRGYEGRIIGKDIFLYDAAFKRLTRALFRGSMTKFEFVDNLFTSMRQNFLDAWQEGRDKVRAGPMTDEDRLRVQDIVSEQAQYAPGFVEFVRATAARGGKFSDLLPRAGMWINKYGEVVAEAMVSAKGEQRLKWVWDEVKEHCFPAGTLVVTKRGEVPIETVCRGDLVLTMQGYKHVTRTFERETYDSLVTVRSGDRLVTCTHNHPFLTAKGWRRADRLSILDGVVLLEVGNNNLQGHISFPNSDNGITDRAEVFVLRPVSTSLTDLPFCQGVKSRVSVPIVLVGLDDDFISNKGINDKLRFDEEVGFVRHSNGFEYGKQLLFQGSWIPFLKPLFSLNHFLHLLWMRFVPSRNFSRCDRIFHRVMLKHIFARGRTDQSFDRFPRQSHFEDGRTVRDLFPGQPKSIRNGMWPLVWVMLNEVSIFIGRPQSVFGRVLGAIVSSTLPDIATSFANRITSLFYQRFRYALPGVMDVSAFYRAEMFFGGANFPAQPTFMLSHNNALSSDPKATLYTDPVKVYNLEVEDAHHYVANGFVVHNCASCRDLNGRVYTAATWEKQNLRPMSMLLECGPGRNCGCRFEPTNDPITKGPFPVWIGNPHHKSLSDLMKE